MRGYLDVMSDLGLEPIVLTGQATRAFGRNAAKEMRINHPDIDGVLCFNDLVGLGVLSACQETGIRAGSDLMVVGFDDIEESRDSNPPMTSISCKIPDFAHSIATQILAWVKNGSKPEAVARSPVRLIKRASSGA